MCTPTAPARRARAGGRGGAGGGGSETAARAHARPAAPPQPPARAPPPPPAAPITGAARATYERRETSLTTSIKGWRNSEDLNPDDVDAWYKTASSVCLALCRLRCMTQLRAACVEMLLLSDHSHPLNEAAATMKHKVEAFMDANSHMSDE
jgi:hypothetical protein